MTSDQMLTDQRRFTILSILIVASPVLILIALALYVNLCRQNDLRTIKEWIDQSKCSCSHLPMQHNDQRVTIDRATTANDLVREVLMSAGHIHGNLRRSGSGVSGEERGHSGSTSHAARSSSTSDRRPNDVDSTSD